MTGIDVTELPKRSLNGSGAHLPGPTASEGHHSTAFDIDDGSFRSRPRTLLTIMGGMFILGGMIAIALYRLNTIEAAVNEIPDAIERRIEQSEASAEQQRKINCLQQQIANKAWVCPDAVVTAIQPAPAAPAKRIARKKPADTGSWWSPALAGGK